MSQTHDQRAPSATKPPKNDMVTAYLAAYNVVQFFGWAAILMTITYHFSSEGTLHGLYEHTEMLLKIFQTAALLEVLHAATGMVRSNALLTFVQIASRVFITWGVLHSVSSSHDTIGHLLVLLAWSMIECIRYPFYICQLIGEVPYFLKWARYTFFIALYPIGVSGELLSVYSSLSQVRRAGIYSLSLPNKLNIAFNYYHWLLFFCLMYIPAFPQLYGHMFTLRKKVLSSPSVKTD